MCQHIHTHPWAILIEMENAKLKIKIISIGCVHCECECEKMRCQQLDVRTAWVLRCVSVFVCVHGCFFFCVSLTRLGMSLTLIYSFIFCLLLFLSRSFHFCCSVQCAYVKFCMRYAPTSIAQKSSELYWRAREWTSERVCVCVCVWSNADVYSVCVCVMMWSSINLITLDII